MKNKSEAFNKGKYLLTRKITLAVILIFLYWITRLVNLHLWPIFTDEAIYTRWSQIALHDASFRFLPLTDGKQPLWHWVTMVTMKFISDPLLAGRFTSTVTGFGSLIGIWFLGKELFQSKKVGFLASLLYLISPFSLLYDRMALVDSMLAMFGIWSMYFGSKTAKLLRLDWAMLTGMSIGAGLLTKSPAVFLQYLYPLNLLFIKNKKDIPKWLILLFPTMLIAEAMRNIMRLSPWMHTISRKNLEFVISFGEFFQEPFRWFWGNLPSLWRWWVGSLTWTVMLITLASLVLVLLPKYNPLSLRSKWKTVIYLVIFSALQFLVAAAFGKVIFARYLLFITPPLVLLAAASTERILEFARSLEAKFFFFLFLILPACYLDLKILTDPIGAPIIQADRDQYIDGFTAGWGIDEVVDYLKNQSKSQKVFFGTQGTFGLMPASFELYLWDNPNIEIKGYWPVNEIPEEVQEKAEKLPTYFLYYESYANQIPPQDNIKLVSKYKKGISDRYMYLFRVLPESNTDAQN